MSKRLSAILVVLIVALANLALWAGVNRPVDQRPWAGTIKGFSFSAYHEGQDPLEEDHPTAEQLDGDLALLRDYAESVRTYSMIDGLERVPQLAAKHGLSVTAGAWLQGQPEIDEPEIKNLIQFAKANKNVRRVMVGNEAILRADLTVPQLIQQIKRVRSQVRLPASTAEPWHVWLDHPELVDAVDYIAVQLLPYWEGVPIEGAVDYAMMRYDELKKAYPDKHILISEIGWPSDGPWRRGAQATLVNQAQFIRDFLRVADERKLDYYIMEAFDQPWKRAIEGTAGAHWGIFDVDRRAKFPMQGAVLETANWPVMAGIATALALIPVFWFAWRRAGELSFGGRVLYGLLIQGVASIVVWTAVAAFGDGMALSTKIAWVALIGTQVVLLAILLIDGLELTEVVATKRFRRRAEPAPAVRDPEALKAMPFVSLHLPCYNEPPDLVIETMESLARLHYENFEVLVLDNNTKDPAVWKPLEEACRRLGPKFRFFHLANWPGFKAGALNFGLRATDPRAEVVGVIDADYIVDPDWLNRMVPFFDRREVALVQSPQDHRDWQADGFMTMINWEYAGFFDIGMVQRNERNAIIQHGTMTLVRRKALEELNGWAEWCICEDAELGLRLFESGYEAVYSNHRFGHGLVPDSFEAYKKQRFRWAYGAMMIMKAHWREMMPRAHKLTAGQKYHFLTGWLPWVAEAAHLIFACAAILWSIGLLTLPRYFDFPPVVFMIPTLAAVIFKIVGSQWLYMARVKCSLTERLGASVAGMALTHAVGRAILQGLTSDGLPFIRTPKLANKPATMQGILMAREELTIAGLLWLMAALTVYFYSADNRAAFLWGVLLVVQSLPYLAAVFTSMVNAVPALRYGFLRKSRLAAQAAE